jgi:glycosyltransferase involved in cell wall biosynthesis
VRAAALLMPGRLDTRTGGSIYNRRLVEGLRTRGWSVEVRELDPSFPSPTQQALDHAAGVVAVLTPGAVAIIDSLALGAMPQLVERAATRGPVVALMHLPLAAHPGLDRTMAARTLATEARALAAVTRIVVTGEAGRTLLEPHGVTADRVVVIEPGTDPAAAARGSGGPGVHVLSVATVQAGKGHEDLLEALAGVRHAAWRLTCAGSLTRDPHTAARVDTLVTSLGLAGRVRFAGDLDAHELWRCYDTADAFVLASHRETYGMAVAEAIAHGLPVVATRTGAIPVILGTAAGLVVAPGDVAGLTEALDRVLGDPALRGNLAAGARVSAARLPTWDLACARMAALLEGIDHRG